MNVRSSDMDPSEWVKPKKQRPVRRSLYGALRKEPNVKCLILTGLIYGCIVAIIWCRVTRVTKVDIDFTAFPITSTREISPCDDGSIYIPTAFVVMLYLLYLVECWHCKAWHQLKFEKTDLNSAYQKIHEIRQAQPVVWWKAVCYHYVRRTREVTRNRNGNTYTCTQVYYERVNSHVAAGCFFFALCGMKDVSRELIDLEKHAATKIQLSKGFLFANHATAREFQEQRAAFFQEQERYDDYMEMREGMYLSNVHFKESLISWASPDNPPWFAKISVFWLCNFLLLSWPLRLILELNTGHVHYQVNKLFGVNYMTPSGSELLLTAPRTHGLPINNHQHRILNRAISSHHSRLSGPHPNRRRRSIAASETNEHIDHDDTAPLLLRSEEGSQQQHNHHPHHDEKDLSELSSSYFKNLKDQQSSNNNECSNNSTSNNNDTSPSSSSGRLLFPQWRTSFFSRNFRFARQTGYKLTRSVTLLMTKPERLEFFANTQQQFPDEFGCFGDSDEGAGLLHDKERGYYCSSTPPPPFLASSPEEEEEGGEAGTHRKTNKRLTHHHNYNHRPSNLGDVGNSSNNCLAPSYSQTLLLMEPNERDSVIAYFRDSRCPSNSHNNNPSSSSSLAQPSSIISPQDAFNNSPSELPGLDSNSTNEQLNIQRDSRTVTGIGNSSSSSNPSRLANGATEPQPISSSISASALNLESAQPWQESGAGDVGSSGETPHYSQLAGSGSPPGTTATTTLNPSFSVASSGSVRAVSTVNLEVVEGATAATTTTIPSQQSNLDNDLCISHERSGTSTSSVGQPQPYHACSSTPSTSSVPTGHHYNQRVSRLPSSDSSTVLNSFAPREATGVQIDLTQPIVVTVPRDPLRESTSSSSSSGGGRGSSTTTSAPSYTRMNSGRRAHANFLRHTDADDEPPTYFEALKTSRPVFLPSLARIRRCFTERDIASRFSSNRSAWFDEIADVEGSCGRGGNKAYHQHHHHPRNPQPSEAFTAGNSNGASGSGTATTSQV